MKINDILILEGFEHTLSLNELEPKHFYLLNKAKKDGYVSDVSKDYQRELDELTAARLVDDAGGLTKRGEQITYYMDKQRRKKSQQSLVSKQKNMPFNMDSFVGDVDDESRELRF